MDRRRSRREAVRNVGLMDMLRIWNMMVVGGGLVVVVVVVIVAEEREVIVTGSH